MKPIRKTLALTIMLAPLIAGIAFGHSGSGGSMMGPAMMGDYSDEQWSRFDRSFQDMNRLMERIHESDDPDEHYRLKHDHMHELQNGMMMMGEGWHMGEPDNGGDPDGWNGRMRNMERQMFLMQQMLNQMIEREAAEYDDNSE